MDGQQNVGAGRFHEFEMRNRPPVLAATPTASMLLLRFPLQLSIIITCRNVL